MTQNVIDTTMATNKHKIRARDHPAREAVVYSDRAEVCRPIRGLSLQPGRNEIEVIGLSSQLSGDTVRGEEELIDVMADAAVTGASQAVDTGRVTRKSKHRKLLLLERQKEDLDLELERLNMDYKLLESYSFMFAGQGKNQADGDIPKKTNDVDGFRALLDLYAEKSRDLATRTLRCKREIRDVERRITRERNILNTVHESKKKEKTWFTVKVVLEADEALDNAEFRLSYVVHGARWSPRYDVRVSSDRQQMELHYMAEVVQNTSEEWNSIRMKLSTAMPSLQNSIPNKIIPWRVSLVNNRLNGAPPPPPPPAAAAVPQAAQQMQLQMATRFRSAQQTTVTSTQVFGSPANNTRGFGSQPTGGFGSQPTDGFGSQATGGLFGNQPGSGLFGAPPGTTALDDFSLARGSTIEEDMDEDDAESVIGPSHAAALLKGMMSAFEVNADATVPSDNAPHRVTIAVLDIKATFIHVAFPKISGSHVYLRAFAKNDTDLPLFPGPCNIYVDGSYVTKSEIQRVAVGEKFTCPLGADPSVSIAYPSRKKKILTGGFLNRVRMQAFEQSIHIRNGRSKPIFVQVFDQMPVSEEERLRVELTEPAKNMVKLALGYTHGAINTPDHHDVTSLPGLPNEETPSTNAASQADKGDADGLPTTSTGPKNVRSHPNGLLEWTLRITPSESKSIRFAYQVDCAIEDTVSNL
ncbi:hypothetical protein BDF19DRAFT_451185 [Syncephalis fuscata]|nr:hypothetical protein BDF19DRAFT_451185 [Syncephalis fuscata]